MAAEGPRLHDGRTWRILCRLTTRPVIAPRRIPDDCIAPAPGARTVETYVDPMRPDQMPHPPEVPGQAPEGPIWGNPEYLPARPDHASVTRNHDVRPGQLDVRSPGRRAMERGRAAPSEDRPVDRAHRRPGPGVLRRSRHRPGDGRGRDRPDGAPRRRPRPLGATRLQDAVGGVQHPRPALRGPVGARSDQARLWRDVKDSSTPLATRATPAS